MKKIITKDPRGGHVRLYWELLDGPAWRCLAATDQRAYIALVRRLTGSNNGDLCLTATQAKHHGIRSKTTLAKCLRALVAVGLIVVTREGGCTRGGQRLPNLYAMTSEPVFELPQKFVEARKATNEWKLVSSIAHGKRLMKAAEAAAKDEATKSKAQGQKMTPTGSKDGLVSPKNRSKNGPWLDTPGQEMDHGISEPLTGKPMLALVSTK